MIFSQFSVSSEPCSERTTLDQDLKNLTAVVRNMPDTILKFGGIWLRRFRDLELPKNVFSEKNEVAASSVGGGKSSGSGAFRNILVALPAKISKSTKPNPTKFQERVRHVPNYGR